MSAPLLINGIPVPHDPDWERQQQARRLALSTPSPRTRIFDHLDWHPPLSLAFADQLAAQDRRFSMVARQMRAAPQWFAHAPIKVARGGWAYVTHVNGCEQTVLPRESTSNVLPAVSGEIVTMNNRSR